MESHCLGKLNFVGSSVWPMLLVTFLVPRISRWELFGKFVGPCHTSSHDIEKFWIQVYYYYYYYYYFACTPDRWKACSWWNWTLNTDFALLCCSVHWLRDSLFILAHISSWHKSAKFFSSPPTTPSSGSIHTATMTKLSLTVAQLMFCDGSCYSSHATHILIIHLQCENCNLHTHTCKCMCIYIHVCNCVCMHTVQSHISSINAELCAIKRITCIAA